MGLSFSKSHSSNDSKDNTKQYKTGIPSEEDVTTPKGKEKIVQLDPDLDPRSPTENITRTPIQVTTGSVLDTPTAIYTPKRIILAEDPRSPTTEYHRTPIVVGVTKKSPTLKIHNKNLDKVLKGYSTVSPNPKINTDAITPTKGSGTIVPPKLLETSPVRLVRADSHKRRSCVGLLETNIDFTETDIDEVIMKKYYSPSLKKASSESKICTRLEALVLADRIDPRSPTTDFKRTPIQIIKKLNAINANVVDCASSEEENENKIVDNNLENFPESVDNNDEVDCEQIIQAAEIKKENRTQLTNEQVINIKEDMPDTTTHDICDDKSCEEIKFNISETFNINVVSKAGHDLTNLQDVPSKISPKLSPEKPPRTQKLALLPNPNGMSVLLEHEHESTGVSDIPNKIEQNGEISVTDNNKEYSDVNNYNSTPSNLNMHMNVEDINDSKIKSTDNMDDIVSKQDCTPCEPKVLHDNDENAIPLGTKKDSERQDPQKVFTPSKRIDITADVKDFEKKLTNLIYEDSDVSVLPPIIKNKDSNRTPLGERNINSQGKKASKLKVSDRPRYTGGKSEVKGISKIPTLQNKIKNKVMDDCEKSKIRIKKKVVVQCENTPPRNIPGYKDRKPSIGKSHIPQWDNDATLII